MYGVPLVSVGGLPALEGLGPGFVFGSSFVFYGVESVLTNLLIQIDFGQASKGNVDLGQVEFL